MPPKPASGGRPDIATMAIAAAANVTGIDAGEAAQVAKLSFPGPQNDRGGDEEQDSLHHEVIGHEIQCRDPAEMAHQCDRRHDIAELTHAGIGQHSLHVVLADRHHGAGQGGQHADPAEDVRQIQANL